jgi:hypothetical protein|uniref:Uncharacterized protein n=1 Tax=Siphoviridae sp. ctGDt6 TaxID=2825408 RepID=A0A8S5U7Z5_9CAUD|nr:MAG TPA: hypothetical protein [Siphoviridae sp. ctGDt6]
MDEFLKSVSERDFDRRISEVVEMLEEKQLYGTISLIKDLKYYLDLATKEKAHTCNCQHNGNSRENEPCCRCDSRRTNSDRIRNMSDEELAEFMQKMEYTCFVDFIGYADKGCGRNEISCKDCRAKAPTILEWLQSEAE